MSRTGGTNSIVRFVFLDTCYFLSLPVYTVSDSCGMSVAPTFRSNPLAVCPLPSCSTRTHAAHAILFRLMPINSQRDTHARRVLQGLGITAECQDMRPLSAAPSEWKSRSSSHRQAEIRGSCLVTLI